MMQNNSKMSDIEQKQISSQNKKNSYQTSIGEEPLNNPNSCNLKQKKYGPKNKKKSSKLKTKHKNSKISEVILQQLQSIKQQKSPMLHSNLLDNNHHQYEIAREEQTNGVSYRQQNKQLKKSVSGREGNQFDTQNMFQVPYPKQNNQQQAATFQLLNIEQPSTPNKTSKIKYKLNQIFNDSKQKIQKKQCKNTIRKFTRYYNTKNNQHNHIKSLRKINYQSRIIQSSSQTNLKSSPQKYQQSERHHGTMKKVSNFDILKLHAEKLDKSNILMSSNIKEGNMRNSPKIEGMQEGRNRLKKAEGGATPFNRLDKLEINLMNKPKIEIIELKGNSIVNESTSSRINIKNQKKSQSNYETHHPYKTIKQSINELQNKKNFTNKYKYQHKNQLFNNFTNRSFQYHKNNSLYTSTNNDNNPDEIYNYNRNQNHDNNDQLGHNSKCQEIIKIQDDEAITQTVKYTSISTKKYRRTLTEQPKNSTNEYIINNQFWPTVSRSVIDKNRQNIKKINNIYNKIKSNTKHQINTNRIQKQPNTNCNENIDEFIKTKLSLIQNSSMEKDSNEKAKCFKNKILMTCISFHDKNPINKNQKRENKQKQLETVANDSNFYRSQCKYPKSNLQNQYKHKQQYSTVNEPTSHFITKPQNQKSQSKIQSTTATRFYRPLLQKCKDKANILIVDPYLKTRAMEISAKQKTKKQDIVIICL